MWCLGLTLSPKYLETGTRMFSGGSAFSFLMQSLRVSGFRLYRIYCIIMVTTSAPPPESFWHDLPQQQHQKQNRHNTTTATTCTITTVSCASCHQPGRQNRQSRHIVKHIPDTLNLRSSSGVLTIAMRAASATIS